MNSNDASEHRDRWARLRFAVVGPLLASPPPAGQLRAELERLAEREWEHPCGKGPVRFAASTIERWYYQARAADNDPVGALKRRPRADAGRQRAMSPALIEALREQYQAHPSWSAQLHHENLVARVEADPELGPMPSYATLTRAMRARGLVRQRRRKWHESEARPTVEAREVLSYEVSRSHALWHADMHSGKRRVLTASGEWKTPILLGFLDDHSRLGCHLQWYLAETAEVFVHGLCQAFMKRGLPRSLLTENVARHIFGVMCPVRLCAEGPASYWKSGRCSGVSTHIFQSDLSHSSSDASSRHIARLWDTASECNGGMQASSAFSFIAMVISA